jgi:uncharacterized membrane-anchored protein
MTSCASGTKRNFESITPGMSQNEVRAAMGDGPTRFEPIEKTEFSRWFWGDTYCVLFNQGKVVAKDSTQTGRNVEVGPGKVLRGTLRRIWPDATAYEVHSVCDLASLRRLAGTPAALPS